MEPTEPSSTVINPGETLQSLRESLGLTPKEVSHQLKISVSRIAAFENNTYRNNTLNIYDRGHLRNYCHVLGIEPQKIFDDLEDFGMTLYENTLEQTPEQRSFAQVQIKIDKKWVVVSVGTISALALGFLLYNAFSSTPEVTLDSALASSMQTSPITFTQKG